MKTSIFLSIFFLATIPAFGQSSISIEAQAYPAGVIPGIRFDYSISEQTQLFVRAGYNFTDRRDWGEHDNEEGGGAGFGIGAEFRNPRFQNFSLNVRTDLWFMDIDWYNEEEICPFAPPCVDIKFPGTTEIAVLQPTIGFGYQFPVSGSFFIKPTINFGYEVNIRTEGEDVGEGTILLGGLQVGYLFDAK